MSKKFSNTPRITVRVLTLTSMMSAAFNIHAQAVPLPAQQLLAPVVVSASRFPSTHDFAPIGATVISADQIRAAGAADVNEAIRKIGGVYGRPDLNGTTDFSLDLRGFGNFSDQNLVVLLDGVRLSEPAQARSVLSSIPIESVERIEILRGGSSVLYGEGATGGAIHIITKRATPNETQGTLVASAGNHGHRGINAYVSKAWESIAIDGSFAAINDDNYRDNNESRLRNFSGGLEWFSGDTRIGARLDVAERDNRLPGSLDYVQYLQNRKQSTTPDDYGYSDLNRLSLHAEKRFASWELAAELSHTERDYGAHFVSMGMTPSDYQSKSTQFSPRVRHYFTSGSLSNELVVGIDLLKARRKTDASFSQEDAEQDSEALYARNETRFGSSRVAIGARHERFEKVTVNPLGSNYEQDFSVNAAELQFAQSLSDNWEVFAKAGRSYRVANVDDNAWTLTGLPLKPQTSNDLEVGSTFGDARRKATVRVFQHKLKNEIFDHPIFFANVNLDPTKRRGIELEGILRLSPQLSSTFMFQHISAEFTGGVNAGKEMTLVPENKATLRFNWTPAPGHNADFGVIWVDSQRYASDFDNSCNFVIPSHLVLDARYARQIGKWEFAVTGSNLADKDYFSYGYGCRTSLYPDAGRQLRFSVRRDF